MDGGYLPRTDINNFIEMRRASILFLRGRGNIGRAREIMKNAGVKSLPSYLLRSATWDSMEVFSPAEELHQDLLGVPKKIQKFMVHDGGPFGGDDKYVFSVRCSEFIFISEILNFRYISTHTPHTDARVHAGRVSSTFGYHFGDFMAWAGLSTVLDSLRPHKRPRRKDEPSPK